jgi:hypothetical protein
MPAENDIGPPVLYLPDDFPVVGLNKQLLHKINFDPE